MKRLLISILFLAIGAVLFQGFQCQTREMGSAKNYIKRGEHEKAIKSLKMEIQKNPKNVEAYILLAETKSYLKDYEGAADAILQAEDAAKLPNDKSRISNYKYRLRNRFDEEIRAKYNKYVGTNDLQYVDSAIYLTKIKIKLRPNLADSYRSMGSFLIVKGDTAKSVESFYKYLELMQPEIDFAKEHNIFINAPRQNLVDAIGDTDKNISTSDSLKAEIFMNGEQPVYVVSQLTDNKFLILNWQVDPPQSWDLNEKFFGDELNLTLSVIDRLVNHEYSNENYEKVLDLLNISKQIAPDDPKTMESIVQVYLVMGKEDEAFELLKKLTEKDPGNKFYWNEYGNLYFQKKEYDKALEMFEKALDIDPNFDTALLNSASACIEKAIIIYKQEEKKADDDRNYNINNDAYFPLYAIAAEHLEKVLELEDYQNDFALLKELVILFDALQQTDKKYTYNNVLVGNIFMQYKFEETLSKIKRMEYRITSDQKISYYKTMMSLMGELSAKYERQQLVENPNEPPNEEANPYKKEFELYKEKYKKIIRLGKEMADKNKPKPQQINIELGEKEAEGIYSNLAIISHSQAEFIFDFTRVLPGTPKAKVHARVIMTPQHAKMLQKALSENIAKYEQQHGEIKSEKSGGPGNFPGFTGGPPKVN